MGKLVEAGGFVLFYADALAEILGTRGPAVVWRSIVVCFWHVLSCGDVDMTREVIVLEDDSGLIVDVESQVHIGEIFDKVVQHDGGGFSMPLVHLASAFGFDDLAVTNHDGDEGIVETDGFSNPLPDDGRVQGPKGKQLMVDGVELVNELYPPLLCELVPLVEVWGRGQFVTSPILGHGFAERF